MEEADCEDGEESEDETEMEEVDASELDNSETDIAIDDDETEVDDSEAEVAEAECGDDEEDSIVEMDEAKRAVQLTKQHYEFIVDLLAKISTLPFVRVSEGKKMDEFINLVVMELSPTNPGFKRDVFTKVLKQAILDNASGDKEDAEVEEPEVMKTESVKKKSKTITENTQIIGALKKYKSEQDIPEKDWEDDGLLGKLITKYGHDVFGSDYVKWKKGTLKDSSKK
jgi:hypothetical protein